MSLHDTLAGMMDEAGLIVVWGGNGNRVTPGQTMRPSDLGHPLLFPGGGGW